MTGATPDIPYKSGASARSRDRSTAPSRKRAAVSQLLPIHRLTVIAKTPLLVALGLYMAGGHFEWATVGATLGLSALLWGTLYAVNEAFDLALEDGYAVSQATIALLIGVVLLICGAAYQVSPSLAIIFGMMTAGQLAYCAPPLRLKRWWWPVLLLSGMFNPVLRAYCGAIWGPTPMPAMAVLAIVLIHVGSTIRTRGLQRERDRKLDYTIAPPSIDRVGAVFTALGILDSVYLCFISVLPRSFLLSVPFVVGFTLYAWSDRAKSMYKVRRGWFLFAIGAMFGLFVLLRGQ